MSEFHVPISDRFLGWRDNSVYGHTKIIQDFTGLRKRPIGHIQHGWNPNTGWTLAGKELISAYSIRHVWGQRQVVASASRGIKIWSVIGAPWLYGPFSKDFDSKENLVRQDVVFPYHGTKAHPVSFSHQEFIREIHQIASPNPLACLYYIDFQDANIRNIYKNAGFEVVTLGQPHDPGFLYSFCNLMSRTKSILTNRIFSGIFYGGSLGVTTKIIGNPVQIKGEKLPDTDSRDELLFEILENGTNPSGIKAISLRELGFSYLREPQELAEILGMRGKLRTAYIPLLLASHSARIIRKLK